MFGLKHSMLQCAWFSNLLLFFLLSSMDMKVNLFKLHFFIHLLFHPQSKHHERKTKNFFPINLKLLTISLVVRF